MAAKGNLLYVIEEKPVKGKRWTARIEGFVNTKLKQAKADLEEHTEDEGDTPKFELRIAKYLRIEK